MQFRMRALDRSAQVLTLVLDALDEADAREQAATRQLTPLSIARTTALYPRSGRRSFALLLFVQELNTLISAGLSVIEALEALIEKEASQETRAILARVMTQLRTGVRLSAALQHQRDIFPPLLVGVVQAAEGTSDLPRALQRYLQYELRIDSVREKVKSSAIYPLILLSVGGLVSVFLLGYVVPQFAAIYQAGGRELALGSRLLLSWGSFVGQHALSLAVCFIAAIAGVFWWARTQLRDGTWWRALAVLPGLKQRLELFELSRMYLTLGMLLEGGIPIGTSLKLARSVVSTSRAQAIDGARQRIQDGGSLSDAFVANSLATSVALRLLRVGEQSGQLGTMLLQAALFYDDENARWIERFTKTFEPLLMAAIGIVIGVIVVLLYMPIFDLAGSLQ